MPTIANLIERGIDLTRYRPRTRKMTPEYYM